MTEKLTFVHLTDLHVGDPAVPDGSLLSDTTATLRTILAEVKRLSPPPAFVVVSGDLTNRGDEGSYAAVKAIFAEAGLAMPVVFALGNHDRRAPFYKVMLGQAGAGEAPYDHDLVVQDLHITVLDTTVAGHIGGGLEPAQLDWLKQRLEAHPGMRKLLVMHHGPMLDEDEPTTAWETVGRRATQGLHAVLEGRTDIVGILSGHIHYDRVSFWHGIPVVVGIGQHAAIDPAFLSQGLRSLAGASFAIGTLRPSGLSVSFVPQPSDRRELERATSAEFAALIERYDGPLDLANDD